MIFIEIGTAFVSAVILYAVFRMMRHRERRQGSLSIFLIILLGAWAGGIWFAPVSVSHGRAYWLPFLLGGILISVLAIAFSGEWQPRNRRETLDLLDRIEKERALEKIAFISMNIYLKCLLAFLVVAILIRYLLN